MGRYFRLLGSRFDAFGGPWEVMFGSWGLLLGGLGSLCGPQLGPKAIRLVSGSHLGSILRGFRYFLELLGRLLSIDCGFLAETCAIMRMHKNLHKIDVFRRL